MELAEERKIKSKGLGEEVLRKRGVGNKVTGIL